MAITITFEDVANLVEQLRAEVEGAESELTEKRADLDAAERFMSLASEKLNLPDPRQGLSLEGLSHAQSVFAIAVSNGGTLRITDTKNAMIAAGKFKTPKHGSAAVYGVVRRYESCWTWVKEGSYKLTWDGWERARKFGVAAENESEGHGKGQPYLVNTG